MTDVTAFDALRTSLFGEGDFLEFSRRHERGIAAPRQGLLPDGTVVRVPLTGVIVFDPPHPVGRDLLFSTGVHGNETAPMEIGRDLVAELLDGSLRPRARVMFIIGNPVATNLGRRFETENLNRLFDGRHRHALVPDSYEAHRAAELEGATTEFFAAGDPTAERIHFDLHTAIRRSKYEQFAAYPFPGEAPWSIRRLQLMLSAGISTILLSNGPVGTFSYYSQSAFGAESLTVELGRVRPFGQNDASKFAGITDVMRTLIAGGQVPVRPFDNADFRLFRVDKVLVKTSEDYVLHVADDVANYTEFPVGYILAEDGEERTVVEEPGECIVFPNPNVKVTQRAGMTLVPTTLNAD